MRRFIKTSNKMFRSNTEGATALEFAILALPFFTLLGAIIELAIIFLLSSTISNALNEAARELRTGKFQANCGTSQDFQDLICQKLAIGSCDKLRFDVISPANGKFNAKPFNPTQDETPSADNYETTGAGAPVYVRIEYFHSLAFPGQLTKLSNIGSNSHLITSQTAFRNEPFPENGCI